MRFLLYVWLLFFVAVLFFFFSSRRRHTRCALVTGAQTCALPIFTHRRGGSYLVMEGPQFSSRAESLLYRAAGLDVIGMTAMPEAALAREAELCYQTVAMVTDFDAWHGEHEAVDVAQVLEVLHRNVASAQSLVVEIGRAHV